MRLARSRSFLGLSGTTGDPQWEPAGAMGTAQDRGLDQQEACKGLPRAAEHPRVFALHEIPSAPSPPSGFGRGMRPDTALQVRLLALEMKHHDTYTSGRRRTTANGIETQATTVH